MVKKTKNGGLLLMLEIEEMKRVAGIKGLSLRNTEKDYLLEITLFALYHEAGKDLAFKGGTALYKLHSLNRFSEDLDFTLVSHKMKINELLTKVIKKLSDIGINGRLKEVIDYKNQKNAQLELKGPLFDGNPKNICLISINISLKEKPLHKLEQRRIFSHYTDIPAFDVFVMAIDELLAEKMRALLTRDKARDVYDVWFLLNKGVYLNIKYVNKKLKLYNKTFSKKLFFEKIDEKKRSWVMDLKNLIIGELPDFTKIKREIIAKIH